MKRFIKLIMCIISVCCIFVSMCPISAFAATQYYQVDYNQPQLSGSDFYVEILLFNPTTKEYHVKILYVVSTLLYTATDSVYNTGHLKYRLELGSDDLSAHSIDIGSEDFSVVVAEFLDDGRVRYYDYPANSGSVQIFVNYHTDYGAGFKAINYRVYGSVAEVNSNYSDFGGNTDFSIIYSQANSVNQSILLLLNAMSYLAQIDSNIYDRLELFIDSLNSIDSTVDGFRDDYNTQFTQMLSWFRHFLDSLNSLIQNTDGIESQLDDLYGVLSNLYDSLINIEYYILPETNMLLGDVVTRLNTIIQLLNVKSDIPDEKLTQPDNSDMDNYYDVENGLLDNGNADVNGAVNVQVNQNAMSVIWDLVESALNSHAKVIGMVLTILALGIVALILGR